MTRGRHGRRNSSISKIGGGNGGTGRGSGASAKLPAPLHQEEQGPIGSSCHVQPPWGSLSHCEQIHQKNVAMKAAGRGITEMLSWENSETKSPFLVADTRAHLERPYIRANVSKLTKKPFW